MITGSTERIGFKIWSIRLLLILPAYFPVITVYQSRNSYPSIESNISAYADPYAPMICSDILPSAATMTLVGTLPD